MKQRTLWIATSLTLAGLAGFSINSMARTSTAPASESALLSSIIQKVEAENIGVVIEAEHERDKWEVEVCTSEACTDIKFDAKTGTELKRKSEKLDDALPPADAKPLSEVVKTFEDHQYPITEIEFEEGVWEVYWIKDGRKVKSFLDPITAKNVFK